MGKYYHGTSKENYESILKNGFKPKKQNWDCSDETVTYLWSEDEFECPEECVRHAYESAVVSAAVQNSKCKELYVFAFEIEHDDMPIYADLSTDNMENAVTIEHAHINQKIRNKDFTVYVYPSGYEPDLRIAYLSSLSDNKNMETTIGLMFPPKTRHIIELLNIQQSHIEEDLWEPESTYYAV